MAKSKKTKKASKVSVARILGFCLLGLLAIGVVANVIKALPKEEEQTEEVETLTLTIKQYYEEGDLIIEFEEGMTWGEWIDSKYNNISLCVNEDYVASDRVEDCSDYYDLVYADDYESEHSFVTLDDVITLEVVYYFMSRG